MQDYAMLSWMTIGLIVGIGSKLLFSGRDSGSWTATLLLAVTGAVLDGWSDAHTVGRGGDMPDWIASIVGAVLALSIYRFILRRNLML